jgi:trans-aconitate methyltransferase
VIPDSSRLRPSDTVWDPAGYGRAARFVSDLGASVVALLAPVPGERILDLGCGDGALTEKIAAHGAAVIGVDASQAFIEAARQRGLDARVMLGEALEFTSEFDAVFSNAALHWIRGQDEMLQGVFRALKPGGRFVAEMGGAGNVAHVVRGVTAALQRRGIDGAALNPWYFPSAKDYRARLERHGFRIDTIELFARPTPLPGALADWLKIFAQSFLAPLVETERRAVLDEVEAVLAPALKGADGVWSVDYMRLRFRAWRPA